MKKIKRLIISTIFGLVFGFVCYFFAARGRPGIPINIAISIIISRVLIGFAIGINRFKFIHWTVRGLLIGLVFSLPGAYNTLSGPVNPNFSLQNLFLMTVVMGMIYGILIEFFTSVVFRARLK